MLSDRLASAEHAVLWWDGCWYLRDLGSRNGTQLDTRTLAAGSAQALMGGEQIFFGNSEQPWVLEDASSPGITARRQDGALLVGDAGFLLLPNQDSPSLCIYLDGTGHWIGESLEGHAPVRDGQIFELQGESFEISLPQTLPDTLGGRQLRCANIHLAFEVSLDEEHVGLHFSAPHFELDLGAKAHHYTLLHMARARLSDRQDGHPEVACGWRYQDELARDLGIAESLLHIHTFRARRQLSAAGLQDPGALLERRAGARQIRIGVPQLSVKVLGA